MLRRELPHTQQTPNSKECGAACLSMLFKEYGIDVRLKKIWENVKGHNPNQVRRGREHCRLNRMLLYAEENGFHAVGVSANNLAALLSICKEKRLEVILLHKETPRKEGHFSLFSDLEGDSVFVNNPLYTARQGKNKRVFINNLELLMAGDRFDITRDNTVLVFATTKSDAVISQAVCASCNRKITLIEEIHSLISAIVCPHEDSWIILPMPVSNNTKPK